ncbi:MAG: Cof-type HAD-IIB family hydrolase [Spirochaetaceae bacterium]|nr:Cof-type HAD-IIB family hydrolase [Spirochaetaceae bacterium]
MNIHDSIASGSTARRFNAACVQALALDLDGTLLRPDNTLSSRTIAAVQRFLSKGGRAIICTGRSIEAAEPYRAALGAQGPMVYFNGAQVAEGETIRYAALLDLEIAAYCVGLSRRLGLYYQMYLPSADGKSVLLAERRSAEAEQYQRHTGIAPVIQDLEEVLGGAAGFAGCIKGMFICGPDRHELIRKEVSARFGGRMSMVRSSPTFLEILCAGVSKGRGLQEVLNHYRIDRSQVMAFGDEENDLSLFAAAGFSAAPANAKAAVQAAADMVIGSNAEDGVAGFLESPACAALGGFFTGAGAPRL